MAFKAPHPSLWEHLSAQFSNPPVVTVDLTGKTVIVLGASTGLGFEASKHFARMKPERLILAVRSQEKGDAAAAVIKSQTGYDASEVWLIDLLKLSSVRAFAERWENDGGRLDIFVANAGILPAANRALTEDGWEEAFQTNNLSTHLLSILLLPSLLKTAELYNTTPRLVTVSSGLHYTSDFKPEVIESENPTLAFGKDIPKTFAETSDRYVGTKLFNVLFTVGLASRVKKQRIVINAVDPGYCVSSLGRNVPTLFRLLSKIQEFIFARSTEQGSRQLIWAALAGADDDMKGTFVAWNSTHIPARTVSSDLPERVRFRDLFWDTFLDELIKAEPKVAQIIKRTFD